MKKTITILLAFFFLTGCTALRDLKLGLIGNTIDTGNFGIYKNDAYYKKYHGVKNIYLRDKGRISIRSKDEFFFDNIDTNIIPKSISSSKNINQIIAYLFKNNWKKLGYSIVENEKDADFIVEPFGSIIAYYSPSFETINANIDIFANIYNKEKQLGKFSIIWTKGSYSKAIGISEVIQMRKHPNPFAHYIQKASNMALKLIQDYSIKSF